MVDPERFSGRHVFRRFIEEGIDYGVYRGTVQPNCTPGSDGTMRWSVLWSDNQTTRLNREDMIRYCIDRIHGDFETPVSVARRLSSSCAADLICIDRAMWVRIRVAGM